MEQWINIVHKGNPELPILFLGTKLDLEDEIQVEDDYARTFLDEFNMIDYFKVSSKTGDNVHEAFSTLTRKILENQMSY